MFRNKKGKLSNNFPTFGGADPGFAMWPDAMTGRRCKIFGDVSRLPREWFMRERKKAPDVLEQWPRKRLGAESATVRTISGSALFFLAFFIVRNRTLHAVQQILSGAV